MNEMAIPVITLDGPAGAGKGAVGQRLAVRLNWNFLDSGALYRTYEYLLDQLEKQRLPAKSVPEFLQKSKLQLVPSNEDGDAKVVLNGIDIGPEIRSASYGAKASEIAVSTQVRSDLLDIQRNFRKPNGLVADGRDMGTVVFPKANLKVFITAKLAIRAERKYKQLKQRGFCVNFDRLYSEIEMRDERDANRSCAPLVPPAEALMLDTSSMNLDEVIEYLERCVRENLNQIV